MQSLIRWKDREISIRQTLFSTRPGFTRWFWFQTDADFMYQIEPSFFYYFNPDKDIENQFQSLMRNPKYQMLYQDLLKARKSHFLKWRQQSLQKALMEKNKEVSNITFSRNIGPGTFYCFIKTYPL